MKMICEDWWEAYLRGHLACQLDSQAQQNDAGSLGRYSNQDRALPQLEHSTIGKIQITQTVDPFLFYHLPMNYVFFFFDDSHSGSKAQA